MSAKSVLIGVYTASLATIDSQSYSNESESLCNSFALF